MSSSSFDKRIVVVTGAAQGIGAATVAAFAEWHARVVSFDLQPVSPAGAESHRVLDIADPDQVESAIAGVVSDFGSIDVLVNNAGIQRIASVADGDTKGWSAVMRTNLFGAYHCTSAAMRRMQEQRRGAIITISSVAAFLGMPGRAPYAASKAALLALTRTLATEAGSYGVRVNAVAPGSTRTQLVTDTIAKGLLDEDALHAVIPLRRLAQPSEIAAAVRFLASDDASYITGEVLVVDGGWSINGAQTASATSDAAGA